MKHTYVLVSALIVLSSINSFAAAATKTASQEISEQMMAALNSSQIQEALSVEDGLGTLKRVEYFQPNRTNPNEALIEITFHSHGPRGLQNVPLMFL